MEHAFIEIPFIRGSIFCGSHGRKLIAFGHQFIEFFNNYEIQKYCLSIVFYRISSIWSNFYFWQITTNQENLFLADVEQN